MTDRVHTGETWRRTITITDTNGPVDPTDLTAIVCPEQPATFTRLGPGSYEILLTEDETAGLTPGSTHWELWGRIGTDLYLFTHQKLTILGTCGP